MRFPSQEWADAARIAINASRPYAEAARGWEGDILLLVIPEDPSSPRPGVLLDLSQGSCRSAQYFSDSRDVRSEFVYRGSVGNWGRLMRHELDPVAAILGGAFQIKGNLAKAMRFTRAAKELVEAVAAIPADVAIDSA